jgi:CBS domain-containing protein
MATFRPSPAIVVPADMPIGDAVRKMRENDVGSLLVVREVIPHDLVGIFTERDLVHKVDEIQHGGYWNKGIASVMTKPVISVSLYELKQAPEIMKRCHIRHLPVVFNDEDGQNHIVGVISMRDLFDNYYEMGVKTSLERDHARKPQILLACKNPQSIGMLRTILSQGGRADITELDLDAVLKDSSLILKNGKKDLLILDLDYAPVAKWVELLRELNRNPEYPACVILFTPDLHEAKNTNILKKLHESHRMTAYAKPINILGLLDKVQQEISAK